LALLPLGEGSDEGRRGARTLAVLFVLSRVLRSVRLALHPVKWIWGGALADLRWPLLLCLLLPALSQAADEVMAVIVAPGHAKVLKKDDLALVFKRKKLFWSDGGKMQPVNLPTANPLRRAFSLAVLGATPEELEQYWNDMYFHGISPPFVLGSEQAVLRFVAETPGAVGYVPLCHVDSRVAIALVISAAGHVSEDTSTTACPR